MLYRLIEERLQSVVASLWPDVDLSTVLVRPCPDLKFGDYQSNALMNIAKERKQNPRQLATEVASKLDLADLCEKVEIAGAGFLNFRLKKEAMAKILQEALGGRHLFIQKVANPKRIVVDFSSPNVAKPMHVGHIRSTNIGDCLNRTLRFLGHDVITDNHIGDWGTQFGKLLTGWKADLNRAALTEDPMGEMERLYKKFNAEFEANEEAKKEARNELVKLQGGDPENLAIWQEMIRLSLQAFDGVYKRLGVTFDHVLGESFYNPFLGKVVVDLLDKGIARESEGAKVVFFDDIPDLKGNPAIIQKSDGGANYATTDLATISWRLENWNPSEIVYVTDARQQLHFRQLFATFKKWHPESKVALVHVGFGMILDDSGKPFKTRTGENVKLHDLLDEAESRAFKVVGELNPELPEDERKEIGRIVGLGAIKYADLMPNRQSDYTFNWDKMLALNGNTAPYILYAYTRTRGIVRKAETLAPGPLEAAQFALSNSHELDLARHLLNFGFVLTAVGTEFRPNYLCAYLYELAGYYSRFFEHCPVLKAEGQEKADRLALSELTGRVLKQGLHLLGIETTERM